MTQQENNERTEAQKASLGCGLADCLTAAPVFAWLFAMFLSGAFYRGNDSVTQATVFASAAALGALAVLPLALAFLRRRAAFPSAILLSKIALVALGTVSGTAALGLVPLLGMVFGLMLGAITGAAVACLVLGSIVWASARHLVYGLAVLVSSYAVGVLLFFGLSAWVPQNWLLVAITFLPIIALAAMALLPHGAARSSCFTGSMRRSHLRSMLEPSSFGAFATVSGVLFGYCYNVYPKSTRFAGVHADVLIGSVTPAAATFLVVSIVVAIVVAVAVRVTRGRVTYVLSCFVLVAVAVLYFNLPTMPTSGAVYVLLNCLACYGEVFVLAGLVLRWSQGSFGAFRSCILRQAAGGAVGAVTATLLIELTTPAPLVSMPVALRDFMIVGMPTVGFVVLALLLFRLAQDAVFPPASVKSGTVGLSDLAQATGEIARRFALTPREGEILGMLLQGRSGPYIAEDLYLSKSTVKTHIRHIYDKLDISSRQQLIDKAHDVCQSLERCSLDGR